MSHQLQSAPLVSHLIGWFLSMVVFTVTGCGGEPEEAAKSEPKKEKPLQSNTTEDREIDHTEITPFKFPDQVTAAFVNQVAAINDQGAYFYEVAGRPVSFKLRVGWSSNDLDYLHDSQKRWEIAKEEDKLGETLYEQTATFRTFMEEQQFLILLEPVLNTGGKVGLIQMRLDKGTRYQSVFEPSSKILPKEAFDMTYRGGAWHPGSILSGQSVSVGETIVVFFKVIGFEGNGKKRWLTYTLTATGLPNSSPDDEK